MKTNFELPKDEAKYVDGLLNKMMEKKNPKLSVKENVINFYLSCFPEQSGVDAERLMERVIDAVSTFTQYLEESNKDSYDWVDQQLQEATKDLSLSQKYEIMLNFLLAVRAVDMKVMEENVKADDFDAEEKWRELLESGVKVSEGEITQQKLDELMQLVRETMQNSSIIIAGNSEVADLIKDLASGQDTVKNFVQGNWDDAEFKIYASVASYIAYLQGETPSVPENTEPETIAIGVSAGIERNKIIAQASTGKITWEAAVKALKILGFVSLLCLFLWVSVKVVVMMALIGGSVLGALLGGSVLAFVFGTIVGGYLGCKGMEKIADAGAAVVTAVGTGYDKLVELISQGYHKASALVKDALWPAVKEQLHKLWEFVTKKITQGLVKITTAVDPAQTEKSKLRL